MTQTSRSLVHQGRVQLALLLLAISISLVTPPAPLSAGMPMPLPDNVDTILRLGEEPAQRVQVISFFLLGLLVSAFVVQWIWNGLRVEFPRIPRLSYGRSLMLTVAWGLLFCVVLVMISGARELMTPGAWEKEGATYQLTDRPAGNQAQER